MRIKKICYNKNKRANKNKKSVKVVRKPINNIKQHSFTVLINKRMSYTVKT